MRNIFLPLLFLSLLFTGCAKDDLGPSIIDTRPKTLNSLDKWIRSEFNTTYNIEVIYQWDATESDLSKNLVPAKMKLIKPLLQLIQKGWLSPYELIAGDAFLKTHMMKQIFLIGSPGVNQNGTITQGTAEGGRKVIVYQVNDLEEKDPEMLIRYFHIFHHEFSHILHQLYNYSQDYKLISKGKYMSEWYEYSTETANKRGFITPYAMSEPNEDFCEMIATLLTNSRDAYQALLQNIPKDGLKEIKQKESIIVNYFLDTWKIDLYKLQDACEEARINALKELENIDFNDDVL